MSPIQVRQYLDLIEAVLRDVRERVQPDIVHAHHLWMMTAKAREVFEGIPMIATAHNVGLRLGIKAPHLLPYVNPGIRACDRVCVLTPHSREQTIAQYGVSPERIAITGAGYRDDLFFATDMPRVAALRLLAERHGVQLPDVPLVTFVGRLSTAKGIPFLLQAVQRLKCRPGGARVLRDFKLVLVGATGSGADGQHMDGLVGELGEHVIHLGAQPEETVAAILRCTSVFVLPSLFEGLPLVMLEAVASGCPSILSDLPTVRSWVPGSWTDTGLFHWVKRLQTREADVPVLSDVERFVTDLADAIAIQLQSPPPAVGRLDLAERARPHAWSQVFARYRRIYDQLLPSADVGAP